MKQSSNKTRQSMTHSHRHPQREQKVLPLWLPELKTIHELEAYSVLGKQVGNCVFCDVDMPLVRPLFMRRTEPLDAVCVLLRCRTNPALECFEWTREKQAYSSTCWLA